MRDYIIHRVLILIPMMIGVSLLIFFAFRFIPGDSAYYRCGLACTPQVVQDIRDHLGLDRAWYEQYGDWLLGVVQGDLGNSLGEGEMVVNTELARRLPVTGELIALTMVLALVLGIPPGVLSAIRPGTPFDWMARLASVVWLSVPSFYLGTMVIVFGAAWFGWSPPQFGTGYVSPLDNPWANAQQFLLPSLVLSLPAAAVTARLLRSSLLDVMSNDYIRTAWSKGLRERAVVWRHALKNAFIPVITIMGLQFGGLIGGTVIIESVFAPPPPPPRDGGLKALRYGSAGGGVRAWTCSRKTSVGQSLRNSQRPRTSTSRSSS
ncbi:MAG: ABC transporter permease [Dehalococcoidia bacterium]|nr:ABC transporter permease [Dehalococcoidia bacterium]